MPSLLSLNSYHYPRGGSDVVYFEHARMFERAGWRNTFFSMHHPRNVPSPDARYFAKTVDWDFAQGAFGKARAALASVHNRDARHKLRSLLAVKRPDIAHAHCIYHHLTPAVFPILARAGVPIVLTAHDLKLACPAYKMMNSGGICERCREGGRWNVVAQACVKQSRAASAVVAVEAYVHALLGSYRKAISRIVAPSRFYREKLIEWGWQAERIVHIPNFVPSAKAGFIGTHLGPILYFGRIAPEKGLVTLVRAAAASGVPVEVAGTGPQEADIRALICKTGAPVRLLGRLDGDALWRHVGQARAVVLPSQWYENAPMSALEAMLLARPVIGAAIGGIPEVLPEGTGALFPSGDASTLAAQLSRFAAMNEDDLAAMGHRAREHVERNFSRRLYRHRMEALYAECMREPRRHG